MTLEAAAKVINFTLKSHKKLQFMPIRNKNSCNKMQNRSILAKNTAKHGILAKSRHLMKIMVSVTFYCLYK